MQKIVAYYRVSTERQGRSGLGLEAQMQAIKNIPDTMVLFSFVEVESGAEDERPELAKAIDYAQRHKLPLAVAKLDRLSRDAEFLLRVRKLGIKLIIADMQNHSTLEYNIRAVIAQEEREKISVRTKEALAAAKARGVRLGNPRLQDTADKGRQTISRRAQDYARKVSVVVKDLEAQGIKSLNGVGRGLEARGILTPRGCKNWSDMQVSRLLKRVRNDKPEASQKQTA